MQNNNLKSLMRFGLGLLAPLLLAQLILANVSFGQTKPAQKTETKREVFQVTPAKSELKWTGKKVTGEHFGTVGIKSGKLEFEGTQLVGGEFIIDMKTIKVDDVKDEEWNTKLKNHLENDDFFAITKHPEATFKITNTRLAKGGATSISGDLTIKGKTKPVSFEAKIERSENEAKADGKIIFNRTHYDIQYRSGSIFDPKALGDKLIYDDVQLQVHLVAAKTDK